MFSTESYQQQTGYSNGNGNHDTTDENDIESLRQENVQLKEEVQSLTAQLQQYKGVSEHFERRVLDLQGDLRVKEDEITKLTEKYELSKKEMERLRHQLSSRPSPGNHDDSGQVSWIPGDEQSNVMEPEQFRKVFIGGLNYETTEESLKKHFEQWGEAVDCVVLRDTATKRSRGFGFIIYKRAYMVDVAQKNRPHVIDGKEVETKRAVPRSEAGRPESHARIKKLFVGGLMDSTTEESLRDYFSAYGQVESVDLIEDRETKRKRGFAYVCFNDYDPVDKAVLVRYHTIDGRRCEVKKALSKQDMQQLKMTGGGPMGGGGGGGGGNPGGGYSGGWSQGGGPGGWNSGYNEGGWGGGPGPGPGSGHYNSGPSGGPMRNNFSHRGQGPYGGGFGPGGPMGGPGPGPGPMGGGPPPMGGPPGDRHMGGGPMGGPPPGSSGPGPGPGGNFNP